MNAVLVFMLFLLIRLYFRDIVIMLMEFQCFDLQFDILFQRIHCFVNMLMNCAGKKVNENYVYKPTRCTKFL